jgi:serine/threonine protein kinase
MTMAEITPLPPVLNLARPFTGATEPDALAFARMSAFKGKYELLSVLGSGGMGVVYKARQILLDKMVAIKMMRTSGFSTQALKRFEQEAKAASSLLHPNLITIRDYGVADDGQPYMVFDFIDGTTLGETIKAKGQLDLEQALDIFIQVAKGLSYAHQHGVLHRDIKPDNIIITEGQREAKIVDFGIAKVLDHTEGAHSLTQTGEIFGTPLYMSPEQGIGKKLDARSDLYSMGCVMFEALTAMPPFVGESAITTILKHQAEKPSSLKEASLGKEFPRALERAVDTLLAKNPDDRYQSAEELINDLLAIKSSLSGDLAQTVKTESPARNRAGLTATQIMSAALGAVLVLVLSYLKAVHELSASKSPVHAPASLTNLPGVSSALEARPATMSTLLTVLDEAITVPANSAAAEAKLASLSGTGSNAPETRLDRLSTGLDLSGQQITPDLIKQICSYHKLKELIFRGGKFIDHPLGYLKNDVNSIDFSGSNVSDQDLQYVKVGSFPEELIFDHTPISDKGVHYLAIECALLKVLSLNYTNITDLALQNLGEQYSLKVLRLNGDRISDKGMKTLHWFKNLEELDLQSVTGGVTAAGIGYLAEHHTLRKISISDIALIAALRQIPQLHEITIYSNTVTDEELLPLAQLPDLVHLTIYTDHHQEFNRTRRALPRCDVKIRKLHLRS